VPAGRAAERKVCRASFSERLNGEILRSADDGFRMRFSASAKVSQRRLHVGFNLCAFALA